MNLNQDLNSMPQGKLILAGGLIIVLAAVSWAFVALLLSQRAEPVPSGVTVVPAQPVVATPQEYIETTQEAVASGEMSACAALANDGQRSACEANIIISKAISQDDISICASIQEEGYAMACRDKFYIGKATAANDPTICDKVENEARRAKCLEYMQ